MKKILKSALMCAAVAATVLAVSCKPQEDPVPDDQGNPETTEFTITMATVEHGSAKAFLGATEVSKAKEGDVITVRATADTDYEFTGWTSTPTIAFTSATDATTTFTMPAGNITVTPTFKSTYVAPPELYSINFQSTYDHGTVAISVAGEDISSGDAFEEGTEVLITVTTAKGYGYGTLDGVTIDPDRAQAQIKDGVTTLQAAFLMPAEDITISTSFHILGYALTWEIHGVEGQGGGVIDGGTISVKVAGEEIEQGTGVDYDTEVTVTATPIEGFYLMMWGGTGLNFANANAASTTFTMPNHPAKLIATFRERQEEFDLAVQSWMMEGNGKIEIRIGGNEEPVINGVSGTVKVAAGTSVNVKAVPDPGWKLSALSIKGISEWFDASKPEATVTMPTGAVNIGAKFVAE